MLDSLIHFSILNVILIVCNAMFTVPSWPSRSPTWRLDSKQIILLDAELIEPNQVALDEIQTNSEKFPIHFPLETVRCKTLKEKVPKIILERNINSAYPVLNEDVLPLFVSIILHKRKFGTQEERKLYADMSVVKLVDRLLSKRAVSFVGVNDSYILLDGRRGYGIQNLALCDSLSYDEIELSAFLSVSSYSYFINDGNRHNKGLSDRATVEEEGVVIGLIGPRFEKPKVMEYQEVIYSSDQNTEDNGYGIHLLPTMRSYMAGFYGRPALTYDQIQYVIKDELDGFVEIAPETFFDKATYCKRLTLSFDTLLHESNQRAKERNTTAFVHVVGIGLGVWKISPVQRLLFLDTFAKRIEELGSSLFDVTDVVFSYFGDDKSSGGYKDGDVIPIPNHPKGGIQIHFAQRQPHSKLTGNDVGKLLIVSYAWDGNALPGNDFWYGSLDGSGDSAQASSSQISEIHNPHINPKVCGASLRIATRHGLIPFSEYREDIAKQVK